MYFYNNNSKHLCKTQAKHLENLLVFRLCNKNFSKFYTLLYYCGWLKFRGVPIFVVFVEGSIHEFQIFWMNYEKKILWRVPWILNPQKCHFCSIHENWYPRIESHPQYSDKLYSIPITTLTKLQFLFVNSSFLACQCFVSLLKLNFVSSGHPHKC